MSAAGYFETVPLSELEQRGLIVEQDGQRPVILVVDNEAIIADTRAAILSAWGYAVLTAYDSASALEIAAAIPPEVLISDVMMPGLNGVELAAAMRALVPDCKIILISGRSEGHEVVADAQQQGHELTLVTKPMHPAQLCSLLIELKLPPPDLS